MTVKGKRTHPEPLIERPKGKDKLSVQKRTLNAIDLTPRNSPESSIALNCIITKLDRNIVQGRIIRGPQLWRVNLERKRSATGPSRFPFDVFGVLLMDCDLVRTARVCATVDGDID